MITSLFLLVLAGSRNTEATVWWLRTGLAEATTGGLNVFYHVALVENGDASGVLAIGTRRNWRCRPVSCWRHSLKLAIKQNKLSTMPLDGQKQGYPGAFCCPRVVLHLPLGKCRLKAETASRAE